MSQITESFLLLKTWKFCVFILQEVHWSIFYFFFNTYTQSTILFKSSCEPKNILENFLAKFIWAKIKTTIKMEVIHQRTTIVTWSSTLEIGKEVLLWRKVTMTLFTFSINSNIDNKNHVQVSGPLMVYVPLMVDDR